MKKVLLLCALGIAALAANQARADVFSFSFTGPNADHSNPFSFSGSGTLYADYSGSGDIWSISAISGTVTTETYANHNVTDTNYDIGGLLPASPAVGSFDGNDNVLYFPGYPTIFTGPAYFDGNGVSFSLVGSADDVNLNTNFVWIFPVNDQATDGSNTEAVVENVCWQGPGDPPAATPEPGSLALLGTSILGGAGLLRRRFRM